MRAVQDHPVPLAAGGRSRALGSLGVGAATLAGTLYTGVLDPSTTHAFPLCPLKLLTHLDCPLCGSLRSVHALTRGDVVQAMSHNLLFVLAVPYLVAFWVTWVRADLGRGARLRLPRPALVAVLVAAAAFTIARNTPWAPVRWLGSA